MHVYCLVDLPTHGWFTQLRSCVCLVYVRFAPRICYAILRTRRFPFYQFAFTGSVRWLRYATFGSHALRYGYVLLRSRLLRFTLRAVDLLPYVCRYLRFGWCVAVTDFLLRLIVLDYVFGLLPHVRFARTRSLPVWFAFRVYGCTRCLFTVTDCCVLHVYSG